MAVAMPMPTHFTKALDEKTGCPHAVRAENYPAEEIAGPLPENWHPAFFEWRPRNDPNGAWVEAEADRRAAIWNEVKADREARMAANVAVTIGKRKLMFQADDVSLARLQFHWTRSQADPAWPGVNWITAGNASVHLDQQGLATVIAAIGAAQDAVFDQSQAARARINNTGEPLLRSLDEVKAALPRT